MKNFNDQGLTPVLIDLSKSLNLPAVTNLLRVKTQISIDKSCVRRTCGMYPEFLPYCLQRRE